MAPTDIRVEALDPAALPLCLPLSREAGWNQLEDDWRIFFDAGAVFGVRRGDALLGSGAVLPYGGFGWISMVLVTAPARGQGLGTAILTRCFAALEARGAIPVLDATPAGERIYRPLGFLPQLSLMRWRGLSPGGAPPPGLRPMAAEDLPRVVALDAIAHGAARPEILHGLWRRAPDQALMLADGQGAILARPGRTALQLGPILAPDEAAALRLLQGALARVEGPVLLDVPQRWQGLADWLRAAGFAAERPFLRMARHREEPFGDSARGFAIAGPELG